MSRRIAFVLIMVVAAVIPAGAASAATVDKSSILRDWTQPTAASTTAWNAARLNRAPWEPYRFDWSTDYCSASPENPLGFDFRLSCWHHDFGYRNYKAAGQFPANKARIDDTFYADLKRVCAGQNFVVRPACYSLAWTYYQAVHLFGTLAAVSPADLDRAARIKAQALSSAVPD